MHFVLTCIFQFPIQYLPHTLTKRNQDLVVEAVVGKSQQGDSQTKGCIPAAQPALPVQGCCRLLAVSLDQSGRMRVFEIRTWVSFTSNRSPPHAYYSFRILCYFNTQSEINSNNLYACCMLIILDSELQVR